MPTGTPKTRIPATALFIAVFLLPIFSPQAFAGGQVALAAEVQVQGDLKGNLDAALREYQVYRWSGDFAKSGGPLSKSAGGRLQMRLGDTELDLELEPDDVRSRGYQLQVITKNGLEDATPGSLAAYRGRLKGRPDSRVRLVLAQDAITGTVRDGDSLLFMESAGFYHPDAEPGLLVVYRPDGARITTEATCAFTAEDGAHIHPEGVIAPAGAGMSLQKSSPIVAPAAANECAVLELGMAADFSMMGRYKTVAGVEARVLGVFNMVKELYADPRINIELRVAKLVVETENLSTWGKTGDFNALLRGLAAWAKKGGFGVEYDAATVWFSSIGGGQVGLAYGGQGLSTGVVCNLDRNTSVVRDYTNSAYTMMIDQAHELAHNFGAPHINNAKYILNPSITGKNDQWDQGSIDIIVAHKNSRKCLSSCAAPPSSDFAMLDADPCRGTRQFQDLSANAPTQWDWNFGDGATSKERNPVHQYLKNGTYTVSLTTTNAYGKDVETKNAYARIEAPQPPTTIGAKGCQSTVMNLSASGPGTLEWYEQPIGGNRVGVGTSFATPPLNTTRTYWVQAVQGAAPVPQKFGPAGLDIGPGGYFSGNDERRLYFDVLSPVVLKSVKVDANSAGVRNIEILDSFSKIFAQRTVSLPKGQSRVELGVPIFPANGYAIKITGAPASVDLFRNESGAKYPYLLKDKVRITGTDAGSDGYFYYFYDWEVTDMPCASGRVPAEATVNCPSGISAFTANTSGMVLQPRRGIFLLVMPEGLTEGSLRVYGSNGRVLADRNAFTRQGDKLLLDANRWPLERIWLVWEEPTGRSIRSLVKNGL